MRDQCKTLRPIIAQSILKIVLARPTYIPRQRIDGVEKTEELLFIDSVQIANVS